MDINLTLDDAPQMPSLTLNPEEVAQTVKEEVAKEVAEKSNLTPEEQKVVDEFASKIDIENSTMVLGYGAAAQKKIAGFSDTTLENIKTKDLGEVGQQISNLIGQLREFDAEEEQGGFLGFFKKQSNKIENLKTKYESAETTVNRIVQNLEGHQVQLMKDVVLLDKLYEMNLTYHKELTMYILAGKKRLEEERATTLVQLKAHATQTGFAEDAQKANDFGQRCDAFEKKIHDLELTRMVSIQMSPQIRMVQNNDRIMVEKIQSTIVNTIPLWKSQMVLSMGLSHSKQALNAQREVTNMTNELLKKNADALKMSTIETAKESERGIVDMETLRHTNQSLITTLDEVMKIQEDGKTRRRAAEQELVKIESELKDKLLQFKN